MRVYSRFEVSPPDSNSPSRHPQITLRKLERETGFEPATNSLEGCDSTPELLPPFCQATKMDQAKFLSHQSGDYRYQFLDCAIDSIFTTALLANDYGGGGWIRTTVGLRRQIYSLLPLSTRPHLQETCQFLRPNFPFGPPPMEPAPGLEPRTY